MTIDGKVNVVDDLALALALLLMNGMYRQIAMHHHNNSRRSMHALSLLKLQINKI